MTSELSGKMSSSPCQLVLATFLFCFINLLNYMNRYATPQVVGRLKIAFQVDDTSLGLIPTCFEICYVLCSPVFGYLGDRLQRRLLIVASLLLSTVSAVFSSFVPESSFFLLLLTRSFLGISEAAYINICPSLIGDLFVGKKRSLVLAIYQFAQPLGCGVGFVCSAFAADFADDWRWAFRITPLPMIVCAVSLMLFFREPERGEAENVVGAYEKTTFKEDISYLTRIPSYVLITFAFIGVAFSSNALLYWVPDLINRMHTMKNDPLQDTYTSIVLFGLITTFAGVSGVVLGLILSSFLVKPRAGPAGDGIVSGIGAIVAAPFCFLSLFFMARNIAVSWFSLFISIISISMTFSLFNEITLNVVIATRRSTAKSLQTTTTHLFGDATSAYFSGKISDMVRWFKPPSSVLVADFECLQSSLYLSTLMMALGGGLYLCASLFINKDTADTKYQLIKIQDNDKNDL